MKPIPDIIGGAKVICASPVDLRHVFTRKCKHTVAGVEMGPAAGVAICQYENVSGFYLFGCDQHWNCVTDTFHDSLEGALEQAEFEYNGIGATITYKAPVQSLNSVDP